MILDYNLNVIDGDIKVSNTGVSSRFTPNYGKYGRSVVNNLKMYLFMLKIEQLFNITTAKRVSIMEQLEWN